MPFFHHFHDGCGGYGYHVGADDYNEVCGAFDDQVSLQMRMLTVIFMLLLLLLLLLPEKLQSVPEYHLHDIDVVRSEGLQATRGTGRGRVQPAEEGFHCPGDELSIRQVQIQGDDQGLPRHDR